MSRHKIRYKTAGGERTGFEKVGRIIIPTHTKVQILACFGHKFAQMGKTGARATAIRMIGADGHVPLHFVQTMVSGMLGRTSTSVLSPHSKTALAAVVSVG